MRKPFIMAYVGILAIGLSILEINLTAGGAEGWTLIDFILPVLGFIYLCKRMMERRVRLLLQGCSLLPLLFFLFALLHILTSSQLGYITREILSYRVPIGGFRLYWVILINVMLYYLTPLVMDSREKLSVFFKMFLVLILLQIGISFLKVAMGIEELPWDTYTSSLHQLSQEEDTGTRVILLGNMGFLLFSYSVSVLRPGTFFRRAGLCVAAAALVFSGGRGMLLGGILFGLLYLFFEKRRKAVAVATALCAGGAVLIFSLQPSLLSEHSPLMRKYLTVLSTENPDLQSKDSTRISMWRPQVQMIARHPVWGTFDDLPSDIEEGSKDNIIRGESHNVYLGIASCFGIPTLLIWSLFVMMQIRKVRYMLRTMHDRNSDLYRIGKWTFYVTLSYLFMYLAIAGAEGGHRSGYLILSMVDVISNLKREEDHGEKDQGAYAL